MQIIQFKENQKEVWNKFITENNSESFLQSWEWGSFNCVLGRKVWRFAVIEDNKKVSSIKYQVLSNNLIAVVLIVKYDLSLGRSYLYCPRGPVIKKSKIKNQKSKVLDLLSSEIRKIAGEEKSLFLRIDPPVAENKKCMNTDMNLNAKGSTALRDYGAGEYFSNFKKSSNEIQPRNTLMLDLTKSEEELLKEMKQKTRYNIRLAKKKELRITNYELRIDNKNFFKEKFEEFWKLIEETSARDKFASHNKNYYWRMLESLNEMQKALRPCGTMEPTHDINEDDIRECRLQAKLYLAEYNNKTVAANIVLYFGDLAIYLHGASSSEYRNLMAPYLLQWRQILDAKKMGCKKYDFWGIAATKAIFANVAFVENKKNGWGGITRFKKGFGGFEKNYIGAYDLVFDNIGYRIYKLIKLIKLKVHKIKGLF